MNRRPEPPPVPFDHPASLVPPPSRCSFRRPHHSGCCVGDIGLHSNRCKLVRNCRCTPPNRAAPGALRASVRTSRSSNESALGGRSMKLRTFGRTNAGHDSGDTGPWRFREPWSLLALLAADEPTRNWRATSPLAYGRKAGVGGVRCGLGCTRMQMRDTALIGAAALRSAFGRAWRPPARAPMPSSSGRSEGCHSSRARGRELLTLKNGSRRPRPGRRVWAEKT